jgi:hypothetical protein
MRVIVAGAAALALWAASPAMAQTADCTVDFNKLSAERVSVVEELTKLSDANRKNPSAANAQKACTLLGRLAEAEERIVGWVGENGDWCAVPEAVRNQTTTALEETRKSRTETCNVAKQAGAAQQAAGACQTGFESRANKRSSLVSQLTRLSAQQKKNPTAARLRRACNLLGELVATEDGLAKWIRANTKKCNIPADIGKQLRTSLASTRKSRTEACAAAEQSRAQPQVSGGGGGGAPSAPGGGIRLPQGAL